MNQIDKLKKQLGSRQIDRRDFVRGALAVGLSVPAAMAIADGVKAATPKMGGRFRMGLTGGATSDSLDPAQILDSYMINVSFGQLRNCLTEIDQNDDLIGELAESWEATADAASWTFKIRKGVEFHNGKTLTATDVAASLNHHLGEDSKSAAKGIIAAIEEVKVDDANTVIFKLSGGSADFPYLMSDYHLGICPANADGSIDWQSGIGTGGYVFDSFEPGVRALTKRNPNYWKSGFGHFDECETLFISDVTARTAALQTGELDAMSNVDLKTVHLLKKTPGVNVVKTTGNQHVTLPMLMDVPPFDNNDLRLALKYAVDREQWLKTILKGYGAVGNDHPIGAANQYQATADEIPQRVYDPDKAKFHLKKAGHDSITLDFHTSATAFGGAVDAAVLYQETAKVAGININVVREPNDGYWSNVWLVKPFSLVSWGQRPTPDVMFSLAYAAEAAWNETHFKHERFNKLLIEARAELDDNKRGELYFEMQQILRDEGGTIVPFFRNFVYAHRNNVMHDEKLSGNWALDGNRGTERWWFA